MTSQNCITCSKKFQSKKNEKNCKACSDENYDYMVSGRIPDQLIGDIANKKIKTCIICNNKFECSVNMIQKTCGPLCRATHSENVKKRYIASPEYKQRREERKSRRWQKRLEEAHTKF